MAARYFRNVGTSWNDTNNWSTTSGGGGGASIPTAADDVIFDTNSGNCVIDVTANALSLTCTGYAGAITNPSLFVLTVSGNVTFSNTMTIQTTLYINAVSTLTSNGTALNGFLWLRPPTSVTITLADAWVCTSLNLSISAVLLTVNGFSITTSGDCIVQSSSNGVQGTTSIVMNGTGTLSNANSIANFSNPITINTAGTITIGTDLLRTGNTTIVAGTIITTGSTLRLSQTQSITNNGTGWNNVTFANTTGQVITLLDNMTINGTATFGSSNSNNYVINGFTIILNGNFNVPVNSGEISGTTNFLYSGTGTWSAAGLSPIKNNLTINTAGTLTISGNVYYGVGTLTYTAGTVISSGSNVNILGGCSLSIAGIQLFSLTLTVSPAGTTTLLANLNVDNLIFTGGLGNAMNGFTANCGSIYCFANMSSSTTLFKIVGDIALGTGVVDLTQGINGNLEINTTGTVRFSRDSIIGGTSRTLVWTSGTVEPGATFQISPNCTISITWPKDSVSPLPYLGIGSSVVITLVTPVHCTGIRIAAVGVTNQINGQPLYVSGNLEIAFATNLGTSQIILNGSGLIWGGVSTIGTLQNNLLIDTDGVYKIQGIFQYNTGTFELRRGILKPGGTIRAVNAATFLGFENAGVNFQIRESLLTVFDKFPGSYSSKNAITVRSVTSAGSTNTTAIANCRVTQPSYAHYTTVNYVSGITRGFTTLTTANNHINAANFLYKNQLPNSAPEIQINKYYDYVPDSFLMGGFN